MQFVALLCFSFVFLQSQCFVSKFPLYSFSSSSQLKTITSKLSNSVQLEVGEVENVVFTLEETGKDNVNKYKVVGSLKPRETNAYLIDYKGETLVTIS
jgi:hypothetical protein